MRADLPHAWILNAWIFDLRRCGKCARESILIHSALTWNSYVRVPCCLRSGGFLQRPSGLSCLFVTVPSHAQCQQALTDIWASVACAAVKSKNAAGLHVRSLSGRPDAARRERQSVCSVETPTCPADRKSLISGPVKGKNVENLLTFSNE